MMSGRYIRIIAVVALVLGLSDAARLLGVYTGADSPLATLGTTGFAFLALFCVARLFAAVGLWIRASWGAVLLLAAIIAELALYLSGSPDVQISAIGFAVRLLLLVSILVIFAYGLLVRRARD
jgi:ABC-type uncharacterized transport system permease subunit